MGIEKYSREVFDQNEKSIDEARELARKNPFDFRTNGPDGTDPAEIIGAKMQYLSGKQKREDLINQAHEEALKENKEREQKKRLGITDLLKTYTRITIETTSGNTYTIIKNPDGETCAISNKNKGTRQEGRIDYLLKGSTLAKDECVNFGNGGNTSPVKSARGE